MSYYQLFTQGRAKLSLAMLASISMVALDVLLINTAMPSLLKDLGGLPFYAWAIGAYSLGNFSTLPIFSVLLSKWGGRWALSLACILFILGALLGTLAQQMHWVVLARFLMGMGGGGFMATPFGLIDRHFPHELKPTAIGALSSVWGFAALSGPALGGFILKTLSWRWIFGLHLPMAATLWVLSWLALKKEDPPPKPQAKVNYLSPLLFSFLSALLLYFFEVHTLSPIFIGLFLIGIGLFYFWEKSHPDPILPLALWKKSPALKKAFLAMALSAMAFGGAEAYLPLSLQGLWGYNPLEAGLILTMGSLAWSSTSLILPKFYGSPRRQGTGGVVALVFGIGFVMGIHYFKGEGLLVFLSFLLAGLGMGLIVPTFNTLALDEGGTQSAKTSMLLAMTWGFSLGPPLVGLIAQMGFGQNFEAQDLKSGVLNPDSLTALREGVILALALACCLLLLALPLVAQLPSSRRKS